MVFSQAKKKNMGGDLTPKSNSENALVSKLNVATIITTNLEETKLFYEKGWQLQLDGPLKVDSKTKKSREDCGVYPTILDGIHIF